MRRSEYPRCPVCGSPVVGAMMTSRAVEVYGERYYHPSVVTVYCLSADCNWERRVDEMKNPPEMARRRVSSRYRRLSAHEASSRVRRGVDGTGLVCRDCGEGLRVYGTDVGGDHQVVHRCVVGRWRWAGRIRELTGGADGDEESR